MIGHLSHLSLQKMTLLNEFEIRVSLCILLMYFRFLRAVFSFHFLLPCIIILNILFHSHLLWCSNCNSCLLIPCASNELEHGHPNYFKHSNIFTHAPSRIPLLPVPVFLIHIYGVQMGSWSDPNRIHVEDILGYLTGDFLFSALPLSRASCFCCT